jgi:hypothetical protein
MRIIYTDFCAVFDDPPVGCRPIVKSVCNQLTFQDNLFGICANDRPDSKVHACIYLLPPTGSGIKHSDLQIMKQLHQKVNLIPVLAKVGAVDPHALLLASRA